MYKAVKAGPYGSILSLYEKYRSVFRFLLVGCLNTGVDFLTFTALHGLFGLDKLICQAAGYGAGIANSFILNKLWTFGNRKSGLSTAGQMVRFVAVNAVSLGVSLLGIQCLSGNLGVNLYISKVLVTGLIQAVNYTGYKLWVFDRR
ncbi:MAG: GtrA family protein [Clostridiales bacterium]|jgi:putative flippase GtrA|nr:GtrA family protein [Eubacteriales bacterium]MDH7567713.1 GtrA family protein [Clostridiales bacterium]